MLGGQRLWTTRGTYHDGQCHFTPICCRTQHRNIENSQSTFNRCSRVRAYERWWRVLLGKQYVRSVRQRRKCCCAGSNCGEHSGITQPSHESQRCCCRNNSDGLVDFIGEWWCGSDAVQPCGHCRQLHHSWNYFVCIEWTRAVN